MTAQDDQAAFDAACLTLKQTADDVKRVGSDPYASEFAVARARRRYDQARLDYLCCHLRLRTANVSMEPGPAPLPVMVVGNDSHMKESLKVLLQVRRGIQAVPRAFERWYDDARWIAPRVVIVDVSDHSLAAASWFMKSLRDAETRPYRIAIAWPERAEQLTGLADAVVRKPLVLDDLLWIIDRIDSAVAEFSATSNAATFLTDPAGAATDEARI